MTAKPSSKWKRIGKWAFWICNLVGILIAIPILNAIWPLLEVYWATRSDAVVESSQIFQTNQSLILPQIQGTNSPPVEDPAEDPFAALTSRLDQIANLDRDALDQMASEYFEPAPKPESGETQFDSHSAFFEDIDKIIREIEGQKYHIYIIQWRDQNGNRSTQFATYKKPNADYERSMQVMKLVQSNPQLKNIYDAFSHVFADMAEDQRNAAETNAETNAEADDIELLLRDSELLPHLKKE